MIVRRRLPLVAKGIIDDGLKGKDVVDNEFLSPYFVFLMKHEWRVSFFCSELAREIIL